MNNRTVIFGASGFIGRALVAQLEQQKMPHVALSSRMVNLTTPESVAKIAEMVQDGDRIVLLSAYTPEKGDAGEMTIKNLLMVQHILKAIKGRDIAHFVYISSDAVYPLTADIVDETTPVCPYSLYGHMHALREQYFKEAFATDRLTIFRPCAVYGHGDSHNAYGICRFIRSAKEKGEIVLFGEGEEYRDHLHVDDCAAIIVESLQKKTVGTYNIASGKSWRFSEIAEMIVSSSDRAVTISRKPRSVPVFHRHVNLSRLWSVFPEHPPRRVDVGLKQLMEVS